MYVAVAGGTGWIGRLVVEAVRASGDTPIVLARSAGVDLTTGRGLDGKLAGDGPRAGRPSTRWLATDGAGPAGAAHASQPWPGQA